jgi:prepilin-type N-terminal cleavage/methylation domain-containing protein
MHQFRIGLPVVKSNSQSPMKNPTSRCRSGFTLVELLVVIAIIAVLAGAGFSAGNAAIQKAKKTTALSTATSLEMAVSNFFTEYGTMPTTSTTDTAAAGLSTIDTDGRNVVRVLLGASDATSLALNPRTIKFFAAREAKANKNGILYSGTTATHLYDPWGGPFLLVLDCDYNDTITVSPEGGTSVTLNGRKVAVWSGGADYNTGKKATDDPKTW